MFEGIVIHAEMYFVELLYGQTSHLFWGDNCCRSHEMCLNWSGKFIASQRELHTQYYKLRINAKNVNHHLSSFLFHSRISQYFPIPYSFVCRSNPRVVTSHRVVVLSHRTALFRCHIAPRCHFAPRCRVVTSHRVVQMSHRTALSCCHIAPRCIAPCCHIDRVVMHRVVMLSYCTTSGSVSCWRVRRINYLRSEQTTQTDNPNKRHAQWPGLCPSYKG